MTQKADNLRVKRTKILLREALIALIEEKGFDALTIGDLTERAMVSRAAFYRNYQDKYDLIEQIFEDAMSALRDAVGEMGPHQHPPEVWVKFLEHIAEYMTWWLERERPVTPREMATRCSLLMSALFKEVSTWH